MPTILNLHKDTSGGIIYAPDPTDTVQRFVLAANAEQHFTLPNSANPNIYVLAFSYTPGASVFVGFNGVTASVPSGVDTTAAELNPQERTVGGGTVVSLITADTSDIVTIAIWALQNP